MHVSMPRLWFKSGLGRIVTCVAASEFRYGNYPVNENTLCVFRNAIRRDSRYFWQP